jgi:hypothetical protein
MAQHQNEYPNPPTIPDFAAARNWAGWMWGGHYVIIQAWKGSPSLVALLQAEGGKDVGSTAEWEVLERPRDVGITEWRGRGNKRLDLHILIEGWVTRPGGGLWIEDHVATLEEMLDTPLTIRVIGPVPHWGLQWVITGIDYGEEIRDVVTGKRMRQLATLHLLEYVQPQELAKLPRAAATPGNSKNYTIVKGDDLKKIAQKALGKAARWPEIEKFNPPMRGATIDLKRWPIGSTIKVPNK